MLIKPKIIFAIFFLLLCVNVFSQNISDSSITRLKESIDFDTVAKNDSDAINHFLELSKAYSRFGDSKEAMSALFSAMKYAESSGNKKENARCLYKIAVLYDRQDDNDHAYLYAEKGLKIATAINDSIYIASCLHRMGLALTSQKKYDEAIKDLNLSLEIRKKINAKSGIAACMNALGLIDMEQNRFDKAALNMTNAYTLWKEIDDKEGIAISTGNLASLFYTMNDLKNSEHWGSMSYQQARKINSFVFMKEAALTLANAYEKDKNFEQAHDFYKTFSEIKDTLINEESNQRIALIQSQFESDKQQAQISTLEKDQESQGRLRNLLVVGIVLVILLVIVIFNRYRIKQKANTALELANEEIKSSHDEISLRKQEMTDSIQYAKKLQDALLPSNKLIRSFFPESLILFKPKDIVSGDFYWAEQWGDQTFIAAVDCTGHGVPGAFMSILGYSLLNRAVNELGLSKPNLILNEMNKSVSRLLMQNKDEAEMKDGMDISLVSIDRKKNILQFSGAHNSLYLFRDNEMIKVEADKYPIGGFADKASRPFTNHELEFKTGDVFYIFTDGYADQFGGPKIKKFRLKELQTLLLSIHKDPMEKQKEILDKTISDWKGNLEQVDDILVVGIKI